MRATGLATTRFAALELSIRPERVAPILRRLICSRRRSGARIYSRDGTLILDSATMLTRGQLSRHEPKVATTPSPRTKNFWTRLKSWMIDEKVPVYKEIGNANGTAYPEIRAALRGETTTMLLLNESRRADRLVAVPIRRADIRPGRAAALDAPRRDRPDPGRGAGFIWTLAAIALVATIVTSLPPRANGCRTDPSPVGGGRSGEPQHGGAHRAAGVRRAHRRGRPDGRRVRLDDGGALPAHRVERELCRRRRPRAEESAHGGALDRRSRSPTPRRRPNVPSSSTRFRTSSSA